MAGVRLTRRGFLQSSAALSAGLAGARTAFAAPRSPNDRLRIGSIGMRYQGSVIADKAQAFGDIVAIADVDRQVAEKARDQFGGQAKLYEDYRDLLARDDVDVVTIGAPDHWHAKMLIDACRAGKDVYCEKPLTLTVEEGRHIIRAVQETKRVVQVGTWQRSDHNFRLACEMVRSGRIGKLKRVDVVLGKNVAGGPFAVQSVPSHLNWDLWQGQTPDTPYIPERCHYTFRWWLEYSGGQMTDWGAHHLDIAHWGMGRERSGPVEIEGKARWPKIENGYSVPLDFEARLTYADGVVLEVKDTGRNGVLFEGSEGRIFVNRGTVAGQPVDDLQSNPLPREAFRLYAHDNLNRPPRMGKLDAIVNHMGNFYDCVLSRHTPLADVESQHRSVSACHLANIALRLGRPLRWNPEREQFVDDAEADVLLRREQRPGFEVA
jgi:predicted dehydrogenase